jgi:hypothetical protein
MSESEVERLQRAVDQLKSHAQDDLPDGPASPLGGEARPNPLKTRSLAEVKRLAHLGKTLVDKQIASRGSAG